MSSSPATRSVPISSTTRGRYPEKSPSRTTVSTTTGQGLVRNLSIRSSRPIRKGPVRTGTSNEMDTEEDSRAANAQVIADLKEQVERAEQASEQYRRQLDALQKQLDEVANETTAAEERELQFRTQVDKLQAELKDNVRQTRELELSYESDQKSLLDDRAMRSQKETELQAVVNRLTENLKLKTQELNSANRRGSSFTALERESHEEPGGEQEYLHALQAKDDVIQTLKLELADFHLRMAEQEHFGDSESQVLGKELLEIKMRNARLQEENESFQVLLSEKTLKGDFMHDHAMQDTAPVSSLAEELEPFNDSDMSPEAYRVMEAENKSLREGNKALTLYVDKIIGRLLQHEGFEHIITDKDDAPQAPIKGAPTEKALPDVPTEKLQPALPIEALKPSPTLVPAAAAASAAAGFLSRARSVVSRPGTQKARPMSYMAPPSSANENPQTAPSIPISRGHRRARSDQAQDLGAAAVVAQMNRGSPLRTASGGPMSPGISPLSSMSNQRTSYFGPALTATSRVPAGSESANKRDSSSNSVVSEQSLEIEKESTDGSSTRASMHGAAGSGLPGAVMKQNQLRPLRLVQEQAQADEDAQKKANRGSWMGWFKQGAVETTINQ